MNVSLFEEFSDSTIENILVGSLDPLAEWMSRKLEMLFKIDLRIRLQKFSIDHCSYHGKNTW